MCGNVACGVQKIAQIEIGLDFLSFFIFLPFEEDIKGSMINPTKRKTGNVKAETGRGNKMLWP